MISPKPATNHKDEDRQTEANNQKRITNSAEYLFDEQRKNRGVDREQTREGHWEQPACREQSSNDGNDKTRKGEILLEKNCSRCHAIGKEGDCPQSASAAVLDPVQQVPHR